jgi:integrase
VDGRKLRRDLSAPKADTLPTLPFEPEDVVAIISAIDRMKNDNPLLIERAKLRARALVYLLLYSGLRISDCIKLRRSSLDPDTGRLMLRQMKTRRPLYVQLHPDAIEALKRLPIESAEFSFGAGTGSCGVRSALQEEQLRC